MQQERVLRYPDGHERRIIYPVVSTVDEDEAGELADVSAGWWAGMSGSRHHLQQRTAASSHQVLAQQTQQQQQQQQASNPGSSLQDTAAFLESLFTASYSAQPLLDVEASYEVLDGCPWPLPRPVFVLTSQDWGWQAADGIQSTYTLRVRVVQEGAADAIAKLLNKQHLSDALEVADMRDGLVMFEGPEDADRFASMLEEEGHSQVLVAEVDSHKAFRLVSEARALVVLLREGVGTPAPYQLAASLKKHKGLDSL